MEMETIIEGLIREYPIKDKMSVLDSKGRVIIEIAHDEDISDTEWNKLLQSAILDLEERFREVLLLPSPDIDDCA